MKPLPWSSFFWVASPPLLLLPCSPPFFIPLPSWALLWSVFPPLFLLPWAPPLRNPLPSWSFFWAASPPLLLLPWAPPFNMPLPSWALLWLADPPLFLLPCNPPLRKPLPWFSLLWTVFCCPELSFVCAASASALPKARGTTKASEEIVTAINLLLYFLNPFLCTILVLVFFINKIPP